ncbi:MAG: biotin/lipoate A/B protein ligase family protein [Nitrospinota bacterium]
MGENKWRIIKDPLGDGLLNMATDRAMLEACNEGKAPPTLRLYGWKRPTLSIGYSQDISKNINLKSCEEKGVPVVRRITGGRALLHQHEMTYSVVAPIPHQYFPGSFRGAFGKISQAIIESLKIGKIQGAEVAGKRDNESHDGARRSPACFSVANHCEITVGGKKLVGSAQRRLRSAFLQHGSVILDMDPQLTHSLLTYSSEVEKRAVWDSLVSNTTSIKDVLKTDMDYNVVTQWFLEGFQKSFPGIWVPGSLTPWELDLIKNFSSSAA